MKKLLITGAASVGLALGAFAQGLVDFNNTTANNGYAVDSTGNYYAGSITIQLWSKAGTSLGASAAIDAGNGLAGGNQAAYASLTGANGWVLDGTFTTTLLASDFGGKALGQVAVPNVTAPNGVFAIACWEGGASYLQAAKSGTIAFFE